MSIRLFVYGTLRDANLCRAVLGREVDPDAPVPARAPGFSAVHYHPHPYPALIPAPHAEAAGLLLDLSEADLARLDAYEGDGYRREPISVCCATGPLDALAYFPTLPIPADALPWRLDEWQAWHKAAALAEFRRSPLDPERGDGPLSP